MKLKHILVFSSVAAVLLVILIISACDESNLDLSPSNETEAIKFKVEDDFNKAAYGMYAKLSDIYSFNNNTPLHPAWLLPGDDLTALSGWPFETFNGLQPGLSRFSTYSPPGTNNIWSAQYQLINRANTILEKLDDESGVITTEGLKDKIRGEALFMRALMHFNLWNFWETCPLMTKRIVSMDDTRPPSSEGTQVLDQVILDLEEASPLLPDKWEAVMIGRVTRNAAYGLLAKACAFRACYNPSTATADYQKAIQAANGISASTQLVADFGANFDAQDENNAESLFEFQASNAPSFDCIWLWNDFDVAIGRMSAYWGFFYCAWSWWDGDGNPLIPTRKLINTYAAGDPRITETFEPVTGDDSTKYNGFKFVKFSKRGQEGDVSSSVNNPRILRLADVLLIKAEAILKSGGSKAEAIGLINQLRDRARNSASPASAEPADRNTAETNEATIMQWIMDERFMELAGEEAHRWFDLRRWNRAGYINMSTWTADDNGFSSVRTQDFKFTEWYNATGGKMWYPIPLIETDNNPNVKQNAGY